MGELAIHEEILFDSTMTVVVPNRPPLFLRSTEGSIINTVWYILVDTLSSTKPNFHSASLESSSGGFTHEK